jgi:excisionase family DNA binding protein
MSDPLPDDELWDVAQAAIFLKYSTSHIYRMTSRHEIPFNKPHGMLRFLKSELVEWVKEGRVPTNAEV